MSGYETRDGQLFNSACTIDFDRVSAATNYTRDYSRAANTYPHSPSNYANPWGLYLTKKISPSGRLQYDQYNFNPPAPKHDMHMPANPQAPEFQAYRGRSRPQAAQTVASPVMPPISRNAMNNAAWLEYFNSTRNKAYKQPAKHVPASVPKRAPLSQWNHSHFPSNRHKENISSLSAHQANLLSKYNRHLAESMNVSTVPIFDLNAYNKAKLAAKNIQKAESLAAHRPGLFIPPALIAKYAQSAMLHNNSHNVVPDMNYFRNVQDPDPSMNYQMQKYYNNEASHASYPSRSPKPSYHLPDFDYRGQVPDANYYSNSPNFNYNASNMQKNYHSNSHSKLKYQRPVPDFEHHNSSPKLPDKHKYMPDINYPNNSEYFNYSNKNIPEVMSDSQNFNFNNSIPDFSYLGNGQNFNYNSSIPAFNFHDNGANLNANYLNNFSGINYKKSSEYSQKNLAGANYQRADPTDIDPYASMPGLNSRRNKMPDMNYPNGFQNMNPYSNQTDFSNPFGFSSGVNANALLYQMQNNMYLNSNSYGMANPLAMNNHMAFNNSIGNMHGFNPYMG